MRKKEKWTFKNFAKKFDNHINKSVSGYNEMQNLIGLVSQWFLKDGSRVYNLGSSTCETELKILQNNPTSKIEFNCIDIDKNMLIEGKKKISKVKNKFSKFKFVNKDLNKISFKESNLIISFLTTPFLSQKDRLKLFYSAHRNLLENGAFILVEKVSSSDPHIQDIFGQILEEMKVNNNLTIKENFEKKRKLRGILQTYDYKKTLNKLNQAGFKKVDILFKSIAFTCYICIKD